MRAKTLQIHWHEKQPIFSCHFEPNGKGRLATAGADETIRIWRILKEENAPPVVEFLSSLTRHSAAVNVVRFAPQGEILASAGDDGNVILWKQSESLNSSHAAAAFANGGEESEFEREHWRVTSMLRGSTSDIYDLAWSPDGRYILTGSVDNTARIMDARDGRCLHVITHHSHFVQGVAWDPRGQYLATQSSDRAVHIYTYAIKPNGQFTVNMAQKQIRMPAGRSTHAVDEKDTSQEVLPMNPPLTPTRSARRSASPSPHTPLPASRPPSPTPTSKSHARLSRIYADETLVSFFRRLSFTPDGSLLLTPAGDFTVSGSGPITDLEADDKSKKVKSAGEPESSTDSKHTVYMYSRCGLTRPPVAHLPGHSKPTVAVSCSPVFYRLRDIPLTASSPHDRQGTAATADGETDHRNRSSKGSVVELPYRVVFAIATQDTVLIYDTQQATPLVAVGNLHYSALTDVTWSSDGCTLMVASTDGFCSIVSFEKGELGEVLPEYELAEIYKSDASLSSLATHRTNSTETKPASSMKTGKSPINSKQGTSKTTHPPHPSSAVDPTSNSKNISSAAPTTTTTPTLITAPSSSTTSKNPASSISDTSNYNVDGVKQEETEVKPKKRRIAPTLVTTEFR